MNFENVNLFNSQINTLSGNFLPITDDSNFSMGWRIYGGVIWLIELINTVALFAGAVLLPTEKVVKDGTVAIVVTLEASCMLTLLYGRRGLMQRVVQDINNMLRNADMTILKDIVDSALKPVVRTFTIYAVTSLVSVIIWNGQPITLALDRSQFFYMDYNLPTVYSAEPFSTNVLVLSTVLVTVGSVYLFLKKLNVDVYTTHMVLMLTVQYRYISIKLSMLFNALQEDRDEYRRKLDSDVDRTAEKELRALCQQQNIILRVSFMLRKLLSVNFSLIYLCSVFRFCFIAVLFSTIPSLSLAEGISVMLFAFGSITQFFLLCSSIQTLSDASTEMTDKAFDEGWYYCKLPMKRIFMMLIMGNNLECKIAVVEKFQLSLPSFMAIMNQSYTIALLFLRMK